MLIGQRLQRGRRTFSWAVLSSRAGATAPSTRKSAQNSAKSILPSFIVAGRGKKCRLPLGTAASRREGRRAARGAASAASAGRAREWWVGRTGGRGSIRPW